MRAQAALVVGPDEGRQLTAGGNRQSVKIDSATGARGFSMFRGEIPVGGGASPHLHRSYEEAFYLISGELEFLLGEQRIGVGPDTSVFVPCGTVHAFRNQSAGPARLLVIHSPASALEMIDELSALNGPNPAAATEIMRRHNSDMVPTAGWSS